MALVSGRAKVTSDTELIILLYCLVYNKKQNENICSYETVYETEVLSVTFRYKCTFNKKIR